MRQHSQQGRLAAASPAAADWHHHGWVGPAIGFGAGVAVGSALAAPYYGYGPDYGSEPYAYGPPRYAYTDWDAYCAARFRTYDPATHTYMGYDGFPHHCP